LKRLHRLFTVLVTGGAALTLNGCATVEAPKKKEPVDCATVFNMPASTADQAGVLCPDPHVSSNGAMNCCWLMRPQKQRMLSVENQESPLRS
jgi:hypothetical protein